jgi:hypothetical protein
MNRNLEDLTHEELAAEALSLARNRFRSKILAVLAIDLRAACDAEEPSVDLARDVIGLIDRLYSAEEAL